MSKESIINTILRGNDNRDPLTKDERKNAQLADLLQRESEDYLNTHKDVIRQGLESLFDKGKQQKVFGYYNVSTRVAEFIIRAQDKEVNMSCSKLTEKEVAAIADLLKTNNSIKTLNLGYAGITDKGVGILADALKENDCLHTVHLYGNAISNKGTGAIGAWLRNSNSITRISLNNTNINDRGVDILLADVSTNRGLFHMNVMGLRVSDKKAKQLKDEIESNFYIGRGELVNTIEEYLTGPDINEARTQQFIKILANYPLHFINVSNGTLTEEAVAEMAKIIKGSREISNIYCHNMSIEGGAVKTIKDMLESPDYPIITVKLSNCNIADKDSQDFLTIARTHVEAINVSVENEKAGQEALHAFEIAPSVRDAVTDYTRTVVVPQLVRLVSADATITAKDKEGFALDGRSMSVLNRLTAECLFKGLSDQQLETFSDHWHQPLQQTKSLKLKDYGGVSWLPLLGQKEIAIPSKITGETGWKLVALTTPAELKAEGEALEHCVGGYTARCANENSHIISVRGPDGTPRSTMEIQTDYGKGTYNIVQNYGRKNTPPAMFSPAAKVPEWLKPQLNNIDYAALERARAERLSSAVTLEHKAKQVIGFDPLDPEKTKKTIDLYGGDMLPPKAGNEALREQLKQNFRSLKELTEIDLGALQIGGKSVFSAPKPEVALPAKKAKPTDASEKERGDIRHAIQQPINILFGKNNVGVVVSKTEEGEYSITLRCGPGCPVGIGGVANKIQKLLGAQVEMDTSKGAVSIVGLTPSSIIERLVAAASAPGKYIEQQMAPRQNAVQGRV